VTWPLVGQYVVNFGLCLFFAAVLAAGLYRTVEMPAQRWLRRFLPAPKRAAPAAIRPLPAPAISAPALPR